MTDVGIVEVAIHLDAPPADVAAAAKGASVSCVLPRP
jgi:hypothetical protein